MTRTQYNSILVIIDRFTKFTYFLPYKEANSIDNLTYTFLQTIISNHSTLQEIISNRETVFTSNFWQLLIRQLSVKLKAIYSFLPLDK
jgi:hypothetical protein